MPWLPSYVIGDRAVRLPITDADFLVALDALTEPDPGERRERALRLLLQSPTVLAWCVLAARRGWGHSGLDFSQLASAVAERGLPEPAGSAEPGSFCPSDDWRRDLIEYHCVLARRLGPGADADSAIGADAICHGALRTVLAPLLPVSLRDAAAERIAGFRFHLDAADRSGRVGQALGDGDLGSVAVSGWARRSVDDRGDPAGLRLAHVARSAAVARQAAATSERALQPLKLAALRRLAYGASHEINNPLANIATRAQLLAAAETDPARRRHLNSIYQQAMRAHEMISDMMLFAHPPAPDFRALDLASVLTRAAPRWRALAAASGWTLQLPADPPALPVWADAESICELIAALLRNAWESREQGTVALELTRDDRRRVAVVTVRDDGPGIDPDQCGHVFDPFYSGREAGRGVGFGLSKAWTIAQLHSAKLDLVETGSAGTIFSVELALLSSEAAPSTDPSGEASREKADPASTAGSAGLRPPARKRRRSLR